MKRGLLIAAGVVVLSAILITSLLSGRKQSGEKVYVEAAAARRSPRASSRAARSSRASRSTSRPTSSARSTSSTPSKGASIAAGAPFLELEREAFLAARDDARAQLAMAKTCRAAGASSRWPTRKSAWRAPSSSRPRASPRSKRWRRPASGTPPPTSPCSRRARRSRRPGRSSTRPRTTCKKTTIYAPLSGRVIALNAEVGEVVVSGTMNNPASVIGTIADLSEILAEIDVDETEVVHLANGQTVVLKVDAIPDREYTGRVVEIGSSGYSKPTQPDVTFFLTKVLFDAPDESAPPGHVGARRDPGGDAPRHSGGADPGGGRAEAPSPRATSPLPSKAPAVSVVFVVEDGKAKSVPVKIRHLGFDRRRDRLRPLRRRAGDHRTVPRAAQARGRRRRAGHHPRARSARPQELRRQRRSDDSDADKKSN
jgi:multidrug efflux pump subunit AcrA (membrane-fusion protein)